MALLHRSTDVWRGGGACTGIDAVCRHLLGRGGGAVPVVLWLCSLLVTRLQRGGIKKSRPQSVAVHCKQACLSFN